MIENKSLFDQLPEEAKNVYAFKGYSHLYLNDRKSARDAALRAMEWNPLDSYGHCLMVDI